MFRRFRFAVALAALFTATLILFAPVAQAGPPLICWPFDIGNAKSLPWGGSSWHDSRADYDLNQLTQDTLALLAPDTPVLVRMETLRRAAIYANKDPRAARELFARLGTRARESQGSRTVDAALAFSDFGYLVEAYKQEGLSRDAQEMKSQNGYEWIKRALALAGADPQMEFAAALVAYSAGERGAASQHLANAVAAVPDGSLLAKNLVSHCHLLGIQAASLDELRGQMVSAKR